MLYITFLHDGVSTLELYPRELVPNIYFLWPNRTKIQRMYQKLLKESNGDHN